MVGQTERVQSGQEIVLSFVVPNSLYSNNKWSYKLEPDWPVAVSRLLHITTTITVLTSTLQSLSFTTVKLDISSSISIRMLL